MVMLSGWKSKGRGFESRQGPRQATFDPSLPQNAQKMISSLDSKCQS